MAWKWSLKLIIRIEYSSDPENRLILQVMHLLCKFFRDKYYLIDERSWVDAPLDSWVGLMGRRAFFRVQADGLLKNKEEGLEGGPAQTEQEELLIN